ncbi:hypothetical protein PENSPDRAFT_657384 [Peniophora sp. CONT]|nr:hypothetical protein PENSPDRAFT_657384 [Peniophora sp. CONT]
MLAMPLPAFDVPVSPLLEDSDWKRITSPRPPSSASAPSIFTIFNTSRPEPWPVPPERPSGLRVDCSAQSSLRSRRPNPGTDRADDRNPRSTPLDADVEDPRSPPHNTAPPNVAVKISAREIFDLPPSRTPGIVSSPDVMSPDLSPPSFPRAQSFHFVDEENRPHTLRRRRAQVFELGTSENVGRRSPLDSRDAEAILKAVSCSLLVTPD